MHMSTLENVEMALLPWCWPSRFWNCPPSLDNQKYFKSKLQSTQRLTKSVFIRIHTMQVAWNGSTLVNLFFIKKREKIWAYFEMSSEVSCRQITWTFPPLPWSLAVSFCWFQAKAGSIIQLRWKCLHRGAWTLWSHQPGHPGIDKKIKCCSLTNHGVLLCDKLKQ